MSHEFTIREATNSEITELADMWQAIDNCVSVRPFGGDTEAKYTRAKSILKHAIESNNACVLVANNGEALLGTITGHTISRPTSLLENIGVIYSLWVEPDSRKKGVGQSLLNAIEQRLTLMGAQAFQVGWDTDNQLAAGWWVKRGYCAYETIASKRMIPGAG